MRNFFQKFFYGIAGAVFIIDWFLIAAQLMRWQTPWIGWLLLVVYLWTTAVFTRAVFTRAYAVPRKGFIGWSMGAFGSIAVLGFLFSAAIVLYRLTPFVLWLLCGVNGAVWMALCRVVFQKKPYKNPIPPDESFFRTRLFERRLIFPFVYVVFFVITWMLMKGSASFAELFSPWQALYPAILPLIFILLLVCGIFVFSKFNARAVLLVLVAQSFLMHAYLPLSHELPWGGDVWRHVAIEKQISGEQFILPVLFGPFATWTEVAEIDIPEVIASPQKYSYGQMWGLTVFAHKLLGTDLLTLNKWLLPVVWGVMAPILLFLLGLLLFDSRRAALFLSFLSLLVFSFQALGAFTLPVSLGYLMFFFVLLLWLTALQGRRPLQYGIAFFFAVLMLFGYALHAIVLWAVILLSGVLLLWRGVRSPLTRKMIMTVLACAAFLIVPVVELIARISRMPADWQWFFQAKQFIGQWSGWFFASMIRPHDIASGNIFFNHTPSYAFVSNLFTDWRWVVILVVLALLGAAALGLIFTAKEKKNLLMKLMALLFAMAVGGSLISWFVLEGERLFARRLDGMVAFVVLLFAVTACTKLPRLRASQAAHRAILLFAIFVLSWFGTVAYASGPDMRVVSREEFAFAQDLWTNVQEDTAREGGQNAVSRLPGSPPFPVCVLADTWLLLALEGISGGAIVGGGFPIDEQFGQPLRTHLHEQLIGAEPQVRVRIMDAAKKVTGAEVCRAVVDGQIIIDNGEWGAVE